MPVKDPKINIVKLPLSRSRENRNASFPRLPRLYLELLENKTKIKQELVNTEYIDTQSSFQEEKNPQSSPDPSTPSISDSDSEEEITDSENIGNVSSPEITSSSEEEKASEDEELSNRLNELLQDDDGSKRKEGGIPPSLKELEEKGQFRGKKEMPELENYKDDQELDDEKRTLLFKFDLLKEKYPDAVVPDYTIHSDYNTMMKSYNTILRKLSLNASVKDYKVYLVSGFMLVEYIMSTYLNFDMDGFTRQQALSMHRYERLLIELGEKSYVPEGSGYPVEFRLLILVIFNAGMFIVSKMICKKTGLDTLGIINNISNPNVNPDNNIRQKKKMRGPTIDLDEIPEMN